MKDHSVHKSPSLIKMEMGQNNQSQLEKSAPPASRDTTLKSLSPKAPALDGRSLAKNALASADMWFQLLMWFQDRETPYFVLGIDGKDFPPVTKIKEIKNPESSSPQPHSCAHQEILQEILSCCTALEGRQ